MAIVRDFQVNNGLEVNLNANVAGNTVASEFFQSTAVSPVVPKLVIDFANSKQLDSRIEFLRSSNATYTAANGMLVVAQSNVPRFEHSNGQSQGLLMEEQRTNLYPQGQFLDSMSITGNFRNAVATLSVIPGGAPDGSDCFQANNIVDSNFNSHYLFEWNNYVSLVANQQVTFSMYMKPISTDTAMQNVLLQFWTGAGRAWTSTRAAYFNLLTGTTTGVAGATGTINACGIIPCRDGWYRLYITATADQAGYSAASMVLNTGFAPGVTKYQFWGAQIEAVTLSGAFLTSYIPTNGATATRIGDHANIQCGKFSFSPTQGTLYVNGVSNKPYLGQNQFNDSATMASFVADWANDQKNMLVLERSQQGDYVDAVAYNPVQYSGYTTATTGTNVGLTNTDIKACVSYYSNGAMYVCGNTVLSSGGLQQYYGTVGNQYDSKLTYLNIGNNYSRVNRTWCGTIKKLMYFNPPLSNSQMQAITS